MAPSGARALLVGLLALSLAACQSDATEERRAVGESRRPVADVLPDATTWPRAPSPGFARDVVLVTIDTLRADALGFAGNEAAETPWIDGLAEEGWVFQRAHAHSVMTLPSHATLLTGQLPFEHGVRDNAGFVLPEVASTLAEAFRAAGYRTGAFVAAFPLDSRYGLDQGFEVYDDSWPGGVTRGVAVAEREGGEVVAAAAAWWRRHADDPRFLWVHLYEPHVPYAPPPPFAERFTASPYLGEVAAADAHVGRLLETVAPAGARSDVLVVVTSDHGEGLGDHGEQTHGLFAYESTLAVPLILWAESLEPARIETLVRHVDVAPTLLEAAGIEAFAMPGTTGRSLWRPPQAGGLGPDGEVRPSTTYFEALHPNLQRGWAPLRGLIVETRADTGERQRPRILKYVSLPAPELYDLASDPAEARNLHGSEAGVAARLAPLLPTESEWPPSAVSLSDDERRALSSLGYLSSSVGISRPRTYGPEDDPKNLVDLDGMIQDYAAAYQAGQLVEAERLARQTVEHRPGMALAHANLAQVLLDLGRVDEALRLMIDAERQGRTSPFLERQLALTLARVGRSGDAVRLMERHADSRDLDALNVLGLVLAEAGQTDRAREVLLRALEVDERNPRAHENLALTSLHAGNWPLCEREARAALALDPALPLAWNYLGIALVNLGRTAEALDAWQQSVELDPQDLDVVFNLGSVAARAGRREVAKPALERFVREASASSPDAVSPRAAEISVARTLLRGL